MWSEFERRASTNNPVRFVMSLGTTSTATSPHSCSAIVTPEDQDSDWGGKFFEPYKPLLAQIPFYPVLGNHDGNETEARGDLDAYLDNFFFLKTKRRATTTSASRISLSSSRWIPPSTRTPAETRRLSGERAAVRVDAQGHSSVKFALDNPLLAPPAVQRRPAHAPVTDPGALGLSCSNRRSEVAFSGHEHNFQISEANQRTGGVRYVVSGAGGELRHGNVRRRMRSRTSLAGPREPLFSVEIEGKTMRMTP